MGKGKAGGGKAQTMLADDLRFRDILRQCPVGIGIVRLRDGVVVDFNDALLAIIGYSRDEVVGRTTGELRLWADADHRLRFYGTVAAGGSPSDEEVGIRRKDGAIRRFQFSATPVRIGGEDLLVGILRDKTEELATQEALRRSEQRLQMSLGLLPFSVVHQDCELRFTGVINSRFGYREDDLLGRSDEDLFEPESATRLLAIKRQVLASGRGVRQEVWLKQEGRQYCFDLLVEPERAADGTVMGIVSAALDITERKTREERYRDAVEDQTEVISRFDAEGRFLFVNAVYCRFFGKRESDLLGHHWSPVAHADDVLAIEERLRQLNKANPVVVVENRVKAGDGQWHWMQFVNRGFFDEAGQLREIQSVGRDVTERHLAEARAQAGETRLKLALEASQIGLWEWDIASGRLDFSAEYGEIVGYGPDSIGHDVAFFESLVHPDDLAGVREDVARHLCGESEYSAHEFRLRRRGGDYIWALGRGRVVARDAGGQPLRMTGTLTDLTAARRLQEERDRAYEELQRLSVHLQDSVEEERRRLASEVHDDLGGTLTAMRFRLDTLEHHLAGAGAGAEDVAALRDLLARATQATRDLCTRLRPAILDDLGLVEACRWYARDWSATTGIKITLRLERLPAEPESALRTDVFRMLQELLTNVARHAAASRVWISLNQGRQQLTLRVRDNGRGLSGAAGGFGLLGLRERARRHGGSVALTSSEAGVRVHIQFPVTGPRENGAKKIEWGSKSHPTDSPGTI